MPRSISMLLFPVIATGAIAASPNPMAIETGADLYDRCKPAVEIIQGAAIGTDERVLNTAACFSYITGFRDGGSFSAGFIAAKRKSGPVTEKDVIDGSAFCWKAGYDNGTVATSVINFLDRNPRRRKQPAGLVLMLVLRTEAPCP